MTRKTSLLAAKVICNKQRWIKGQDEWSTCLGHGCWMGGTGQIWLPWFWNL